MRRVLLLVLAVMVGGIGNSALAVDFENGLYAGFNFGAADNLTLCDNLEAQFIGTIDGNTSTDVFVRGDTDRRNFTLASPRNCKDNDFGLQLFAGWQFVKWFAIEGGWTDLDSTTYTDPNGTNTKSETSGWQVNAVGTLPYLEKIGLFFKVGAFLWDLDVDQNMVDGTAMSSSESGTDFVYGLGFRFPLTEKIGLSLEVQRFEDIGNSDTAAGGFGDIDINLWSAGFIFRL